MKALVLLPLILSTTFLQGAAGASERPEAMVRRFFAELLASSHERAFEVLFDGSYLSKAHPDSVRALKEQSRVAIERYGPAIDWDMLSRRAIGDSIVQIVGLQRLEKHPLIWEFFFFRSRARWFLVGVKFNDELRLPCEILE
jgi:hypothetical protein